LVQISWIFVYEYRVSYEFLHGSFRWYMDLVPFVYDLLKFDRCYLCKIVKNFIVRTKNYNHDFCSNRLIRWMWNMNFRDLYNLDTCYFLINLKNFLVQSLSTKNYI
jgi:hypothetical protein